MKSCPMACRREFLKTTAAGGLAVILANRFNRMARAQTVAPVAAPAIAATSGGPSKVVVTNGNQRIDNILRALKPLEKDIKAAIGNRRVIIKPNNVSTTNQLAATHADALDAILDFLKSIGKVGNALIAESSLGMTMQGFENFGYPKVADKYKVKLMDLDTDKVAYVMAFSEVDARPHPVRVSSMMMDQANNFIISSALLKTHDRVLCTLGLKNVIVGSALKLGGGGFGGQSMGRGSFGGGNDKNIIHGDGYRGINVNLAMLAPMLHPSLTVIDGFEGMEGDGPLAGSPVNHKVCVASLDFIAADVVGTSLMGVNPADLGYLNYLSMTGLGEWDVKKMNLIGEPIAKLAKKYELNSSAQEQLEWKTQARVVGG